MKHSDFPENTVEYKINNVFINGGRFRWEQSTIDRLVREIIATAPPERYLELREVRNTCQRRLEATYTDFVYFVPNVGWVKSDDKRLIEYQRENGVSAELRNGRRYREDNYASPYYPNVEQEETQALEAKHKLALHERALVVNSNGRCFTVGESDYHLRLVEFGWVYERSENAMHYYKLGDKTALVCVGKTYQKLTIMHANGRETTMFNTGKALTQLLKRLAKQIDGKS